MCKAHDMEMILVEMKSGMRQIGRSEMRDLGKHRIEMGSWRNGFGKGRGMVVSLEEEIKGGGRKRDHATSFIPMNA